MPKRQSCGKESTGGSQSTQTSEFIAGNSAAVLRRWDIVRWEQCPLGHCFSRISTTAHCR